MCYRQKLTVWPGNSIFDIDNIGCLEPFLSLQDHFEIRRFLGLICKLDLTLRLTVPPKQPKTAKMAHFWLFGGYQKWHFGYRNQNSETTFLCDRGDDPMTLWSITLCVHLSVTNDMIKRPIFLTADTFKNQQIRLKGVLIWTRCELFQSIILCNAVCIASLSNQL